MTSSTGVTFQAAMGHELADSPPGSDRLSHSLIQGSINLPDYRMEAFKLASLGHLATYTIEASPNLVQWTILNFGYSADGVVCFTDSDGRRFPKCFYHVKVTR